MSEFCEGCDKVPEGIELFEPSEWEYCPYCGTKLVTMAEYRAALAEEHADRVARGDRLDLGKHLFDLGSALNRVGVKSW